MTSDLNATVNRAYGGSPKRDDAAPGGAGHAREFYAQQFARFLRENYRTAYAVMRAYGLEHLSTAEKWMAGKHIPSGMIVGMSFGMHPESARRHLSVVWTNPDPLAGASRRLVVCDDDGDRAAS